MANSKKKIFDKLNPVEGFNPAAYLETVTGEDGTEAQILSVQNRVMWFRMVYRAGRIETEPVSAGIQGTVVIKASVFTDEGVLLATGMGSAGLQDAFWGSRAVECAETKAIGRALANAGFGTQYCQDLDTQPGNLPDAPHATTPKNTPSATPTVSEQTIRELCDKMTSQTAQQTMLASGAFRGEVVLDVIEMATDEGKEDKVAYLRDYAYRDSYDGYDLNDVAACRVMVDAYDKKYKK